MLGRCGRDRGLGTCAPCDFMETGLVRRFGLHDEEYSFELCQKPLSLGNLSIDHWWMQVTSLYSQRRRISATAHNHSEILRLYWAAVKNENATAFRDAQERYLLASLVPYVRAEGSRTVFADAILARGRRSERLEQLAILERSLAADRERSLSREEFHERSWAALGRQRFPVEVEEAYRQLSREVLDGPSSALACGDAAAALMSVQQLWSRQMRSIGRRSGNVLEKLALDVLSYESRAAFHHCYSVTWCGLIPLLQLEDRWTEAACVFHRFWHTDLMDSQSGTSLFHGHIFGLHPATALFMQTTTGPELLGEWLANPVSAELFGRVLNGLLIAIFDYHQRRELAAEQRPRRRVQGTGDLEAVERTQHERQRGQRRR